MKSNIQIFKNDQVNNQIMFVGKDVATALGYANTRKAVLDHVDKEDREDGVTIRDAIGRDQKATFINESGLYSLILSSKLPQAKAFKRWVTAEVLPQIRQTGGYIPTRDADGRELSSKEIIERADAIVGCTLRMLNEPAEDTLTATQVISDDLSNRNLTRMRTHVSYSLKGKKKIKVYMTWTLDGLRFLNSKLGYPNL